MLAARRLPLVNGATLTGTAALATQTLASIGLAPRLRFGPPALRGRAAGWLLVLPALAFLAVFFLVPAGVLFSYSVLTQHPSGSIGLPVTAGHYLHLFDQPLYRRVLGTTLRISLWTAGLSVLLGYPVALVIVRGKPWVGRLVTIVLVAPLVVSIVVRTYGWQLVLANSKAGVANWLLGALGFGAAPLRVMYSETAVVVGSLHVFLPMMVLPLASSLARIKPSLEEAARTLGGSEWRVFRRITLPLSLPGLAAGLTIVFPLTAASYVTPAILGGNHAQMLGNLLEEQVVTVYDWPFSAAIAVVMVVLTFAVNGAGVFLLERRNCGLRQPGRLAWPPDAAGRDGPAGLRGSPRR